MKIGVVLAIVTLIAILYYYYLDMPKPALGPVGDGAPTEKVNGWRFWKGKSFKDVNGGYTGMKKMTGYTQDKCFEALDAADSIYGSATFNPRGAGECYLWKATSNKQFAADTTDVSRSRAFGKLPF